MEPIQSHWSPVVSLVCWDWQRGYRVRVGRMEFSMDQLMLIVSPLPPLFPNALTFSVRLLQIRNKDHLPFSCLWFRRQDHLNLNRSWTDPSHNPLSHHTLHERHLHILTSAFPCVRFGSRTGRGRRKGGGGEIFDERFKEDVGFPICAFETVNLRAGQSRLVSNSQGMEGSRWRGTCHTLYRFCRSARRKDSSSFRV